MRGFLNIHKYARCYLLAKIKHQVKRLWNKSLHPLCRPRLDFSRSFLIHSYMILTRLEACKAWRLCDPGEKLWSALQDLSTSQESNTWKQFSMDDESVEDTHLSVFPEDSCEGVSQRTAAKFHFSLHPHNISYILYIINITYINHTLSSTSTSINFIDITFIIKITY